MHKKLIIVSILTSLMMGSSYGAATPSSNDGTQPKPAAEYSPEAREYYLKAAFLRYVAQFVEWPANTLPPGKMNICVYGLVPSFEALNSINGKTAGDRTINLMKVIDLNQVKEQCQLLFATKTETDAIPEIVKTFQGSPLLTFGDMDGFAQKGGNMNFYIANNRLAIMINPPAVEKSQLKISPRMLRLVTVVPSAQQTTFKD